MEIPGYSQLTDAYYNFSPFELVIFAVLALLLIGSSIGIIGNIQDRVSTTNPIYDGQYSEGIVGFPQYINPVLARTDADHDLTSLIYAGLTRLTTSGGTELDLAKKMEMSSNGESYTFSLREDIYFHDGEPITADDVAYTISLIQDPANNSPLQSDWNSVGIEVIDKKTITFRLSQPFTSFPHTARIGILPKHIWENESSDSLPFSGFNTNPVGSGPYEVTNINRNNEGIPSQYTLTASDSYHNKPYIERIKLLFFSSMDKLRIAFNDGDISAFYGVNPSELGDLNSKKTSIVTKPFNRIFAVFYNQNNNEALLSASVRRALNLVIPRNKIVSNVLLGYGNPINKPLPVSGSNKLIETVSSSTIADAEVVLEEAGWSLGNGVRTNDDGEVLSIELTTADIPELQNTADSIAKNWESIGVSVTVNFIPLNKLSRDVVRPRNYEALLFGQVINQNQDLYPFWHSSGQDDPGLNLAMYTNTNTDEALSNWRSATSSDERAQLKKIIIDTIDEDQPAGFVYNPDFIYILPQKIKNVNLPAITSPADRFTQIDDWYINTEKLWNIFLRDNSEDAIIMGR